MDRPRFVTAPDVFAQRPGSSRPVRFEGLWVAGPLAPLGRATVAVVGTRAPSEGGRARARALGEGLGRAGITVISGLALGVDGAAHAGAVAAGAPTIGILGGGHRHFFPPRNRALAEAMIAGGGAILSPFPPEEVARPWQFLARNGVVAALADAVVVVEAAARSGALNTAGWAANLGIDVLAYPGDVDRPKAAGCNALIRDGATLVRGPEDVLEALGLDAAGRTPVAQPELPFAPALAPLERRIVATLAAGPTTVDAALAALGDVPVGDLNAALTTLEIAGTIRRATDSATFSLP